MLSLEIVVAFGAIVTLIVISPGPNLFLLLRTTPAFGQTAGLANVAGIAAAILSHAMLSLFGVGAIIATSAIAVLWYGAVVMGIEKTARTLRRPLVWRVVQSLAGITLVGLGGRLLLARAPS